MRREANIMAHRIGGVYREEWGFQSERMYRHFIRNLSSNLIQYFEKEGAAPHIVLIDGFWAHWTMDQAMVVCGARERCGMPYLRHGKLICDFNTFFAHWIKNTTGVY